MIILYLILIFVVSFILVKGADLTIKSLSKLGRIFKWSPFLMVSIFVGICTSLPEVFVGITSALHKIPTLSLGNVIGANIINLTLVLGLAAIIASKIRLKAKEKGETFFPLFASFFPVLLALDGKLSRIDGFVLLLIFIVYLFLLFFKEKKNTIQEIASHSRKHIAKNFIFLILGLILLIGSSEIIIKLADNLASHLKLPLMLIGLILVSLGTTLPELTFGIKAAIKKQEELSLGNSLGTIVANSCLALGLAAVIFPIEITAFHTFLWGSLFFLLTLIIFSLFLNTRRQLSRLEGVFLVLFFIVFLVVQFLLNR